MSEQTFRIVLSMEGAQGPVQAFRQTAQAMQQHTQAVRQVHQAARPERPMVGPIARLRRAERQLAGAQTDDEREDAQILVAQAQRRLKKAKEQGEEGGSFANRIKNAILSSRIETGPGGLRLEPLLGKVFEVFQEMAGPAAGVVTGLSAIVGASIEAAKSITELAEAAAMSGGDIGQVTMLSRLGLPMGQIAGAASGLRERLSSDPYAMMAGARLGIGPQPPPFLGNQNFAKTLIDAVSALRMVRDEEEQLRLARMLGIESMVEFARVSDAVWEGVKIDAITARKAITPETQGASRDLMVGLGRLGGNLMVLLETVAAPIIKILAPAINALATIVDGVTEAFRLLLLPVNFVIDGIMSLAKWLDEHFGTHLGGVEENTQALQENTRIMREGMFGGGPRGRGALPGGLSGPAFQKALEGGAMRYGAWQLGAG